jgi:hypothetical protein
MNEDGGEMEVRVGEERCERRELIGGEMKRLTGGGKQQRRWLLIAT